jgi:hypothetical protein
MRVVRGSGLRQAVNDASSAHAPSPGDGLRAAFMEY